MQGFHVLEFEGCTESGRSEFEGNQDMQSRFILNLLAAFLLLIGLVLALVSWSQMGRQAQTADAQDTGPTDRPAIPEGQVVPSVWEPGSYASVRQ